MTKPKIETPEEFAWQLDRDTAKRLAELYKGEVKIFNRIIGKFICWIADGARDDTTDDGAERAQNPLEGIIFDTLKDAHIKRRTAYFRNRDRKANEHRKSPTPRAENQPHAENATFPAPVTMKQVISHIENHFHEPRPSPEWVETWYKRMEENGWRNKNGNPLTNGRWQRELSAWWQQEQRSQNSLRVPLPCATSAPAVMIGADGLPLRCGAEPDLI